MKYSMRAARLLPSQETKIPTNGPKMAPLRITMGSVGIGVAERIPMSMMEKRGPAMPVVGIRRSMVIKSLRKKTRRAIGKLKVARTKRRCPNLLSVFFDMYRFII